MQEQNKFRYIYNGKEVSREEFEKLAGDGFKWFDGDSIVSVPFSSFDSFFNGDFKSRRQINDHLDSVLNVYQNKVTKDIINKSKCSPQCYCDGSCKHPMRSLEYSQGVHDTLSKVHKKEEKDDVITNSNRGEKETMEHLQGVKESEGKLNYELDWDFIQQMAERMSQNKGKYEPYNWTKPMSVEKLKQSLFRHVIEVMKGIYSDDGRDFGHFESIALNAMMINYQLKNNSK